MVNDSLNRIDDSHNPSINPSIQHKHGGRPSHHKFGHGGFPAQQKPSNATSVVTSVTQTVTTITSITSPVASPTISSSSSAKGFFQNTGAVAGTFTAVGLVLLALLAFLVTCLIRRRRRHQANFDREAFAETAFKFEPALLDVKHNSLHEDTIAHMHSDKSVYGTYVQQSSTGSVTKMEESAYGVAGVGAGYRTGQDGIYSRQDQVSSHDMHIQSQQDVGHNASADPIPIPIRAAPYTSDDTPAPKQGTRTSQGAQDQTRGDEYYSQILEAAGLDPGSRSSHLGSGADSGGRQRGMSLSHGNKLYVFPNPYEALQSSPAQGVRPGETASRMDDVYGGYVDEHEHVH